MISFIEVKAKDLEIFGINFEKDYNSFFTKLYFNFFIKEKNATVLDIARSQDNDSLVCPGSYVNNWETGECEMHYTINPKFNKSEKKFFDEGRKFLEILYTKSRIKPYVINPPKKNQSLDLYVLWIDSISGKITGLNGTGPVIDKKYLDTITDKIERGEEARRRCIQAVNYWLGLIAKEHNVQMDTYIDFRPTIYIGKYKIAISCLGKPVMWVSHEDAESIMNEEATKLNLKLEDTGFTSD